MIKQNVFIINFNSLYEILYEIKENLFFEIIKYENESDFIKDTGLNIENSLIVMKSNSKLLNKNIDEKNFFNIGIFPLPFKKLLELINIELIKLKFNHQSKIYINGYELNLNSKFFSKDDLSLKLTEKEVAIILYLSDAKKKHSVSDLQKNIWRYSLDIETHTVETHIYRLRKKITDKFKDKNFILSHKDGYFIE
ncbi:Response regulators consisting of a CheY-like receiver domain and a winged-helix DNA-binding domain [Candidatus Pelagibacter ubique]|uniref:Response regulators consisting of a CheY-like receiver domain and a winged-helix DNA-binding domain n=1 Tax=Pelagibacter ubique TaxID=198252 RepID=A0ABX1SZK7_PELUQ|nr:winged helix-turn-helix domain-containing protein [Candidatus Pelagibacter ubique]NMN67272.1 Response regulators consisting of a CheY-like receiver domain and a winged-helix DNA-binding domain [Candidatus Pelagibacter ubique]